MNTLLVGSPPHLYFSDPLCTDKIRLRGSSRGRLQQSLFREPRHRETAYTTRRARCTMRATHQQRRGYTFRLTGPAWAMLIALKVIQAATDRSTKSRPSPAKQCAGRGSAKRRREGSVSRKALHF